MHIAIFPVSKDKQLVDCQIGENSIPSSEGTVDMSPLIRLYPACFTGDTQAVPAIEIDHVILSVLLRL